MKGKWIILYNKWLKKTISNNDRHELEKQALDDPFIADALEGIELYESRNTAILQEQLENKFSTKKKNRLITLWPYATAASLLLIASVYFLLRSPQEGIESIALDEEVLTVNHDEIVAYQAAETQSITENNVEPKPNYKKTKVSSSKSEMIAKPEVISSSDESDSKSSIGLQTQSLSYHSNIENEGLRDQEPAQVRMSSRPSESQLISENSNSATNRQKDTAPMASATSYRTKSGMPIVSPKSDDDIPNYISTEQMVDIPNNQSEENFADSDITEYQDVLDTEDTSMVRSDQIKSEVAVQKYLYHQVPSNPTPKIGWNAFKDIIKNNMPSKEYLFMRGIRAGDQSTMTIELDTIGNFNIIDPGSIPTENIYKIMKESGNWTLPNNPDTLVYRYTIQAKSN